MILKENILFANRYQLERLLGRGGFSEVWLAKDSYTNLEIAVKVYAPGQGMDSDGLKEFSAELAGVFNLNHSSLLKPTHVDVWEGMPYLIMPYCAQGAISNRIGKMTENEIWKLIHDVASGLAYLHKNDIVHQDIKPDNILLDDNGNYVITDFGISAKARSTLRKSVIGGATSGGTMAYMGPERFSKQPAPTKASDIWSFGAMVYEMITGNVPFGEFGGSMQKAGAEIPEITEPVSDELRSLVEQMLAPEPWNRPKAEQLISLRSTPSESKSEFSPVAEEKKSFLHKWLVGMVALLVVIVACAGLYAWIGGDTPTDNAEDVVVGDTIRVPFSSVPFEAETQLSIIPGAEMDTVVLRAKDKADQSALIVKSENLFQQLQTQLQGKAAELEYRQDCYIISSFDKLSSDTLALVLQKDSSTYKVQVIKEVPLPAPAPEAGTPATPAKPDRKPAPKADKNEDNPSALDHVSKSVTGVTKLEEKDRKDLQKEDDKVEPAPKQETVPEVVKSPSE